MERGHLVLDKSIQIFERCQPPEKRVLILPVGGDIMRNGKDGTQGKCSIARKYFQKRVIVGLENLHKLKGIKCTVSMAETTPQQPH